MMWLYMAAGFAAGLVLGLGAGVYTAKRLITRFKATHGPGTQQEPAPRLQVPEGMDAALAARNVPVLNEAIQTIMAVATRQVDDAVHQVNDAVRDIGDRPLGGIENEL